MWSTSMKAYEKSTSPWPSHKIATIRRMTLQNIPLLPCGNVFLGMYRPALYHFSDIFFVQKCEMFVLFSLTV